MPPRRNYRKKPVRKNQRKTYRKKQYRTSNNQIVQQSNYGTVEAEQVFPFIKNVVFNYANEVSLLAPSGGIGVAHFYRANSLFDPDQSGIGQQPRYYDTLVGDANTNAPYFQYCVLGTKAVVYLRNLSSNFLFVAMTFIVPTSISPATYEEARERGDSVVTQISPQGSGPATAKLSMFRKMNQVVGVKDTLDNDRMRANWNANPTDIVNVVITAWNPDGSTSSRVNAQVQMKMYSKLMRQNDVINS